MTRTLGAALKPVGRRFVYDKDPEEITRPDTVPAALRFAEASELSSGVAHARPRELKPYPRLPSLPDVTAANDEATVIDPPLQQPPKKELASGPRHRTPATISTVPPPSRARQKVPHVERAVPQSEEPLVVERARASITSPPALHTPAAPHTPPPAPARTRWPFALALVMTAGASAAFGTLLGNGSFERVEKPPHTTALPREAAPRALPLPAREAPRTDAVAPNARPSSSPGAADAPVASPASDPPVIRVEDLPLAEEGTGRRVTRDGRPIRAKAARR